MKNGNIDLKAILGKFPIMLQSARKYVSFVFVLGLVLIYAFLAWRISILSSAQPSADATAQTVGAHVIKVDPTVLSKIQKLQDNSVSVKTLFDTPRSNPFQE